VSRRVRTKDGDVEWSAAVAVSCVGIGAPREEAGDLGSIPARRGTVKTGVAFEVLSAWRGLCVCEVGGSERQRASE
jgi:hypothetical protein